jgi:glycosyltransferase involved in cell wall biosynthesis
MDMTREPPIKLSLCVATFNRAEFLGATLETLLAQATDECEVVVADNASTDDTEAVVAGFQRRFERLRYYRQHTNVGFDRNYDRVVTLARGEFCWLMADDDTLKPNAVTRVLEMLRPDLSLILVNMEMRDFSMSTVVSPRWIDIESDRLYERGEMDRLFIELGRYFGSVSNIVLRRSIWLSRDRERLAGSLFIHTGVIFQGPLPGRVLVLAAPLMNYRCGNNHDRWYRDNGAVQIFLDKWPSLIDSLAVSDVVKTQACKTARRFEVLLFLRSLGYSLTHYRSWIRPRLSSGYEALVPIVVALLPRALVHLFFRINRLLQKFRQSSQPA